MGAVEVPAWRVHDTGLAPAPRGFRRLGGAVRHHQGAGAPWPDRVVLVVGDDDVVVRAEAGRELGRWPVGDVAAQVVSPGPPTLLAIAVPGARHLVAAAPGPALDALLQALSP